MLSITLFKILIVIGELDLPLNNDRTLVISERDLSVINELSMVIGECDLTLINGKSLMVIGEHDLPFIKEDGH